MSTTHPLSRPPVQDLLTLVGRVLVAWLFVPEGWHKIMGFAGTVGYIQSQGVPLAELCAAIAIAAELGLGLLLLVGFQARWAALGLAIFVGVITPIFHNYWAADAAQAGMQQLLFTKNIAVLGGLLVIAAFGAGGLSLDGKRKG